MAAMDPSIQAFLDRLDSTLVADTMAIASIQASTAKIDDIISWRPDLERRVADLSEAVAALQLERCLLRRRPRESTRRQRPAAPIPALWRARQHQLKGLWTTASLTFPGGCRRRPLRRRRRSRQRVSTPSLHHFPYLHRSDTPFSSWLA